MTEYAEAKVPLLDEFKGLTKKQWASIACAFALSAILTGFGMGAECMGFLIVAVFLYMVPHMMGVTSPKIKAIVGAVFIVVMLIVGTFAYSDSFKDMESKSTALADAGILDVYYDDGYIIIESYNKDLSPVVELSTITVMSFGRPYNNSENAEEFTDFDYADGVYSLKLDLIEEDYNCIYVGYKKDVTKDQYSYVYVKLVNTGITPDKIHSACFMGALEMLAYIGVVFYVMLIFSELMRRSARKARKKMEAEGRLYPQGYGKCKNCGAMVLPGEINCRKCGTPIEVPDELKVLHKKDFFECSECGTEVPMDAKMCPKCGAVFDEKDEAEIEHADGTVDVSDETFECSECGKVVPANAKRCPYCGADFDEDDE